MIGTVAESLDVQQTPVGREAESMLHRSGHDATLRAGIQRPGAPALQVVLFLGLHRRFWHFEVEGGSVAVGALLEGNACVEWVAVE